jgi:hypothetical protein
VVRDKNMLGDLVVVVWAKRAGSPHICGVDSEIFWQESAEASSTSSSGSSSVELDCGSGNSPFVGWE